MKGYESPSGNKLCKCFDEKCKACSEDSLEKGLCISCNDNYYQKENEITPQKSWINCYKDPDNYFLEGNIYKSCYPSCKFCTGKGNNNKHYCTSCLNEYSFKILNDDSTFIIISNIYF